MANIYQEALMAVAEGARFKVDFQTRSMTLNGKFIIRDGKYEGELGVAPCAEKDMLYHVEELFARYKHSVPSERSESKSRHYFKALPEKDLSDDDMLYGERRDKAQIELELYILCQILNGMEWNPDTLGKWYWKSPVDKDLVILRGWIEPDNSQSMQTKPSK